MKTSRPPLAVFVSCTRGDLDVDCRRYVVDVVRNHAQPVDMDYWVVDSEFDEKRIVELCHDKIYHDTSHYLGLFAYRRGWTPAHWQAEQKSITEAEFDWARTYAKRMAVFMPNPVSQFADELRLRAESQTPDEKQTQERFLQRVRKETVIMEFADPGHLVQRTVDTMRLWKGGGLRQMAEESGGTAQMPSEDDFAELGRARHFSVFQQSFDLLTTPGAPRKTCYLVLGPIGFGQEDFARKIGRFIEQSTVPQPRHISIPVGVAWRGTSLAALCGVLGRELGADRACETVGELAARLSTVLRSVDVMIQIHRAQRFDESVSGMIERFWRPLVEQIAGDTKKRLVILLTAEQQRPAADEEKLKQLSQAPPLEAQDLDVFDPRRAIRLPALNEYHVGEIARWLCRWKAENDAAQVAAALFEETQGHPSFLRSRVYEADLWST